MDNSIIITFVIIICILILVLSIGAIFTVLRLKKRIEARQSEIGAHIQYQREILENRVYSAGVLLTTDSGFFKDANHILIDASKADMVIKHQIPDYSYFNDMGIELSSLEIDDTLVTCLMPFNNKFNKIYENIKIACSEQKYICKRSDEEFIENNTNLRKYIVELILKAKVVIAVLDGRNPNVFYEIGIAHSMGKLVLLLANIHNKSEIPVDFQANRLIVYNDMKELRDLLTKALKSVHYD